MASSVAGRPDQDTRGGFAHGGWAVPPNGDEVIGKVMGEGMASGGAWKPGPNGRLWFPFAPIIWQRVSFPKRGSGATGDLAEELTKLKQRPGKNILIPGSPRLVRSLLRDGLLDELNLNICPIVVGSGTRLFDEMTDQVRLKLVESKTFSTGALGVTYQPVSV